MKKNIYILTVCASVFFFTRSTSIDEATPKLDLVEEPTVEELGYTSELNKEDFGVNFRDFDAFLARLGQFESSNRYDVINSYGYVGKYQFGRLALNDVGLDTISKREFMNRPDLQEMAVRELIKKNRRRLRRQIEKYDGKTFNGIRITESGIIAAAHLAGAGNVKKFFRTGHNFKDGYGTSIRTYLIVFRDFKIEI